MKRDYRALYEALIDGVKSEAPVLNTTGGDCLAMVEAAEGMGLGMMTKGESGEWSAESGEWRVESGEWSVKCEV